MHDWIRNEAKSRRQHRHFDCSRCKFVKVDMSCRGRHVVFYDPEGKRVQRLPKCEGGER